ncbi:hypothetical protein WUBG_08334 [Wuchereria bancrofti]|uniref:Uncharacterized protein n=1 Tax=Wuchereria bancrofti TaxID=6293 RepID=J9EF08_WUCBA|nr:hypothetical protein WUBG_08334 [Wuchereria bancrofti]
MGRDGEVKRSEHRKYVNVAGRARMFSTTLTRRDAVTSLNVCADHLSSSASLPSNQLRSYRCHLVAVATAVVISATTNYHNKNISNK